MTRRPTVVLLYLLVIRLLITAMSGATFAYGFPPDAPALKPGSSTQADEPPYKISATPAADFKQSPQTGYTRKHWEAIFARLCLGYSTHLSAGKARTTYPGQPSSKPEQDSREGAARIMPMIGAWLHDPHRPSRIEYAGQVLDLEDLMRQSLLSGTNPQHADYWEAMKDYSSQLVEVADIALFVWMTKDRIFNRLSKDQQQQIINWLAQVDGKKVYENNWFLFPAIAQTVRKLLGYPYPAAELEANLREIDNFYAGDGWFRDGNEMATFEYYNAWEIHFHTLLWVWMDGASNPTRRDAYTKYSRAFLHHFPYFFGAHGGYPAFGRSLTYRFGVLAPMLLARRMGISPLDAGLTRRLANGDLKFFIERGVIDENHVLTEGFSGASVRPLETYSGTGSPYWATRAFMAFLLPPDDEFWTGREGKLPIEIADFSRPIPATGFCLIGDRATGQVQILSAVTSHSLNARQNYQAKYGKFAYSSHFPFNVLPVDDSYAFDSMLGLTEDGRSFGHRGMSDFGESGTGFIFERFTEETKGGEHRINTAVIAKGDALVRLHRVTPHSGVAIKAHEGTYPLALNGKLTKTSGDDWVYAQSDAGAVFIRALFGFDETGQFEGFKGRTDLNMAWENSAQASVRTRTQRSEKFEVASLTLARPRPFSTAWARSLVSAIKPENGGWTISFSDGEQAWVSLEDEPAQRSIALNGVTASGKIRMLRVTRGGAIIGGCGVQKVVRSQSREVIYESATPGLLMIELGRAEYRYTLSSAAMVARPNGQSVSARALQVDGSWRDCTAEIERRGKQIALSEVVVNQHSKQQGLSLAQFIIGGRKIGRQ
ncbi:MAG: DUF2264 domain-containing protein [Acidobacteria bacterium]|nr:DUF2264 domain-containing protein [Acidobacteriota bacterium]